MLKLHLKILIGLVLTDVLLSPGCLNDEEETAREQADPTAVNRMLKDKSTGLNSAARFVVSEPAAGKGQVVTDSTTGLIWEKQYTSGVTWSGALAYCAGLDYAGFQDWRLANINELMSLVNFAKMDPASDFPDMPAHYFWAATSCEHKTGWAWLVGFYFGDMTDGGLKNGGTWARCVRP